MADDPNGFSTEIMAQAGWDSVTVDMQHGLHDYLSMVQCLQPMTAHPVTSLVRVPWNEPGIIGKTLDAGAWGVICPMVNNRKEAEALVSACLYPPEGKRSFGPVRAALYGGAGAYQDTANQRILVIPMIETKEAIDNFEDILDVPGISGVYVGPSDLGVSLGHGPAVDREDPFFLEIYRKLIEATSQRGQFAGLHTGRPEYAARMVKMGFKLTTVSYDSGLLGTAARETVQMTRMMVDGRTAAPQPVTPTADQ